MPTFTRRLVIVGFLMLFLGIGLVILGAIVDSVNTLNTMGNFRASEEGTQSMLNFVANRWSPLAMTVGFPISLMGIILAFGTLVVHYWQDQPQDKAEAKTG